MGMYYVVMKECEIGGPADDHGIDDPAFPDAASSDPTSFDARQMHVGHLSLFHKSGCSDRLIRPSVDVQ
jgi:hypothetical protein